MLSPAVISILSYALWVVLGFASAVMTFSMLTRQISKIDPPTTLTRKGSCPPDFHRPSGTFVGYRGSDLSRLEMEFPLRDNLRGGFDRGDLGTGDLLSFACQKKAEAVPSPAQTAKEEAEKND